MRLLVASVVLLVLSALAPADCLAQEVARGDRLRARVSSPARYGGFRMVEGHYAGVRADSVTLSSAEAFDRIALEDIRVLERHAGTRSNELLGALLGGPVGVGLALVLAGGLDSPEEVWILPVGFGVGVGAGVLAGSAIRTDVWESVDMKMLASGMSFGFALAFP